MAITTTAELRTAIANWAGRSDLTGRDDEFIALAEARINRVIRSERMIVPEATYTTDSSGRIALPADFLQVAYLRSDTTPPRFVDEISGDIGIPMGARDGERGYAISGGYIYTRPAQADTVYYLSYYGKLLGLTGTDGGGAPVTSNWLLAAFPDIYLYGSLLQMGAYVRDDPRVAQWKFSYDEALQELKNEDRKWSAHSLAPRLSFNVV